VIALQLLPDGTRAKPLRLNICYVDIGDLPVGSAGMAWHSKCTGTFTFAGLSLNTFFFE